ncbi:MAG: glycosidase [Chloroflexota bacterium]|nr:glycosidase [Chloroflexota bacterium]
MGQVKASVPFQMQRLGLVMQADANIPEEVEGVLNPAAARGPDGDLYLLPRIVGKGNYSRIGIARVRFNDDGDPEGVERLGYALEPSEPYELRPDEGTGGCEDPRVTYVEPLDMYVMGYTAWGPTGPRVAIAVSHDLFSWRRLGLANFDPDPDPVYGVDFDDYHNKDAAFFPRPVRAPNGVESIAMLHRPVYTEEDVPRGITDPRPSIWISYCPLQDVLYDLSALTGWRQHHALIDPDYPWEALRIGAGTQPVLTRHGWLLVYHGASGIIPSDPSLPKDVHYSAGALVLDEVDPLRVLYRSPTPILEPATGEERVGIVDNVVFPEGADDRGDGRIDVYYGMADERIGVALLTVPEQLPT